MIKIISEKLPRILKLKKKLEKKLEVKITNRGKEIYIEGSPENEYEAEKVIESLNFGFPFSHAIEIKENELVFEKINIKEHTTRKDLERIRGRLIGRSGQAMKTLSNLTNCFLEIKNNEVGIIGYPEDIQKAQEAIISIIKGSKHSNVYAHLEKQKLKPLGDLGLKNDPGRT